MAQVDSENSTTAPAADKSRDSFASLAAAVHPAWHQAIIRLANAAERVAERMGWVVDVDPDHDPASEYVENVRVLVDQLLEFLDGIDPDPDLEPTQALFSTFPQAGADECEIPEDAEPSLSSFDRMIDRSKSWRTVDRKPNLYGWSDGNDNELDDCDYEDADPAEESEASGIADQDGLDEQVPFQRGPGAGMV